MSVAAFLANFSAQVRRARHPANRGLGGGPAGLQIRNDWSSYSAKNWVKFEKVQSESDQIRRKFCQTCQSKQLANNWATFGQDFTRINYIVIGIHTSNMNLNSSRS